MRASNETVSGDTSIDSLPSQDGSKDLERITPEVMKDTFDRLDGRTVPQHRRRKKQVPFGFIKRKPKG